MNHLQTAGKTAKSALILGATGGIGGAVARALLAHGWTVHALSRRPVHALPPGMEDLSAIEWHPGDAMNEADVVGAAQGVDCIVHALNPPRYKRWRELAIPMLAHSIAAARASGARLVLPGNVYNFGPDAGTLLNEASPQHPVSRKGAVRVEMEQMLQKAADTGVRSLVVRAGDFFGGHSPSSWLQTLMVKPGRTVRSVWFPGEQEVGHTWAYLPDLAEAIVRLMNLEDHLPAFDVFNFAGHWTPRGIEMAESIRRVVGDARLPIRSVPWPVLYLAAPFVTVLREVIEMRYLWKVPLRLDNRKLRSVIGDEPHTELDVAVRQSLLGLGCLPAAGHHELPTTLSPR
ncbi:MAG: NAD-dependent epimerase/dehydratase family protein [Burkholderiales bacterium]|nr:NAD-dependent epimerase/dehydratase family protein [Burkholderiales bacterium]